MFCFVVPPSILQIFVSDGLPPCMTTFVFLYSWCEKNALFFVLFFYTFTKKSATSAPPGVDVDAGSTSGSLQLSPTFSRMFIFCSGVALCHLFLSVVNCLLLAIAPAWLSKSCVRYVIRGARAREMNKHQRGCEKTRLISERRW